MHGNSCTPYSKKLCHFRRTNPNANQSIYEQWSDYVRGCSLRRDEVREAYRKLSAIHHPDKGGDHERMAEINTAYDMLMS
jgi:hypothetical protein